ncbi:MAG: hypothetical protein Ta2B_08180 [Termitinemataceae bacterium]|nr:MAG: hypothetical protein Ta2B_08180 [Termitinemataceae bacterium]
MLPLEESRPLDESKITESDLTFYYSRERRLAKAPQKVRDLYDSTKFKKGNLFTSLVDTKSKSMMFIAIIALCVLVLLFTYVNPAGNTNKLLDNAVEINALSNNEITFVVIKKTALKKSAYTGIVDVNTASINGAARQQTNKFVWTDSSEDEIRYSVPFAAKELIIHLQAMDKTLNIKVPVK